MRHTPRLTATPSLLHPLNPSLLTLLHRVLPQFAVLLAGLYGQNAVAVVDEEGFVELLGLLLVAELVFVEAGEGEKGIVEADALRVVVDDLLVLGGGFGVHPALLVDAAAEIDYVVLQVVVRECLDQAVEGDEGLVEAVLEDEQFGVGVSLQRGGGGVKPEVIEDEDGEVEGVVGNEAGGGGLEHVELRLRPFESRPGSSSGGRCGSGPRGRASPP